MVNIRWASGSCTPRTFPIIERQRYSNLVNIPLSVSYATCTFHMIVDLLVGPIDDRG